MTSGDPDPDGLLAAGSPAAVLGSRRPIDPAAVTEMMTSAGWTISHSTVTGSTNADLSVAAGLPDRSVLTTEEQLTGRGRSGRDWFCPAGAGLMFSVLLRVPEIPVDRRGWTGAVLGLAIVRAIALVSGVQARLKWPNDVLIDGRKCAGILGEVVDDALIVGAGINVSLQPDELPRQDATSLWLEVVRRLEVVRTDGDTAGGVLDRGDAAGQLDRGALLAAILDNFAELLDRWVAARGDIDASGLRSEYRSACSTIGARVLLMLPGGAQSAVRAVDVGSDGALVVVDANGSRRRYAAGEVIHVRPG